VKIVEKEVYKHSPKLVYTHFNGDLNIDHIITARAVMTACRPVERCPVKKILAFETASATGWGFDSNVFKPMIYNDITKQLDRKLRAMQVYDSEMFNYPHPRSIEALRSRASFWGTQSGLKYAEPFQLIREIIN